MGLKKHKYNLHMGQEKKPVRFEDYKTGRPVTSWTPVVSHEKIKINFFSANKTELKELFDFSARKVVTIDPDTDIITAVDDFDDKDRKADIDKAYKWVNSHHPKWCF